MRSPGRQRLKKRALSPPERWAPPARPPRNIPLNLPQGGRLRLCPSLPHLPSDLRMSSCFPHRKSFESLFLPGNYITHPPKGLEAVNVKFRAPRGIRNLCEEPEPSEGRREQGLQTDPKAAMGCWQPRGGALGGAPPAKRGACSEGGRVGTWAPPLRWLSPA